MPLMSTNPLSSHLKPPDMSRKSLVCGLTWILSPLGKIMSKLANLTTTMDACHFLFMFHPPSPTAAQQTAKATIQHLQDGTPTHLSPSVGRLDNEDSDALGIEGWTEGLGPRLREPHPFVRSVIPFAWLCILEAVLTVSPMRQ